MKKQENNTEVVNTSPNIENETVSINTNGILISDLRNDLKAKKIIFKLLEDEDKESEVKKKFEETGVIQALSLNSKELNGNKDIAQANLNNIEDKENKERLENLNRHSHKLELFKVMISDCAKETKGLSFTMSNDLNVPSKPKNIKTRKQYKKAKLKDGKTFRKYVYVNVNYNRNNYTLIEIEKDELLDKLTTLIIKNKDNTIISEGTIYTIVKVFIDTQPIDQVVLVYIHSLLNLILTLFVFGYEILILFQSSFLFEQSNKPYHETNHM